MSNGDGEKRLDCLICTNELSASSSFSIFYTVIPHSGHLLANVIQKVLRIQFLEQSSLPSTFVCKKCFSKFQEYDRAEERCNNLKKEILKIFNNSCEKNDFNLEATQGVACQTEDTSDNLLSAPETNLGVKLELRDSCESNDEADESSQKFIERSENHERRTPRNKRKGQPAKKTASSLSVTEKDVSVAKASSESPEKSQTQSEGEPNENSSVGETPKFEIRTKDARRRRRYVHPCALCGRLFRRPCEVKQHLLSHGGAKPYKCQLCLRRFGSKSGAGIHALKKHGKDVAVENIIEVCNDVAEGGNGYPAETIKELLEQSMKEDSGKDHSDGSDSSDGDDDFEWKLENEDELFGGGNDDEDSKQNLSGMDTSSQLGGSEAEGDLSMDGKTDREQKEDIEKPVKEMKTDTKIQKENEKKTERKTKASSASKSAASAASSVSSNAGNDDHEDGRKKRKRKKREPLPKVPKHECPICGKMWRTMSEFKSHVNTHSDERPYICEICGQAYKHKAALDIHVGMHNGINPFCCPYCNKAFTQKGALQRHMPIHTGEAPFQCELCGKRFVHHTSFNMHTLAHTGQKSYKCQVCGLALLSGSHLKRHSRVHTGERPYQCTTCGKRFAERYNLVAHTRVHDPLGHGSARESSKKLHKCQLCGASFDRRPKLEDHLALSHNKISDGDDSRKWVGHLISAELGGHGVLQPGQAHPHTGASTAGVPHAQTHPSQQHAVAASGVVHPPPPLVPGTNHSQPPPPEHHHPHHHPQQPQHHPQPQPQPPQPQQQQQQQQHVWHHVLFGKGPDSHVDADQHRLLSEMSALGAGLGAPGRGVLSSCLAGGHPSLGGHPHHMGNPHALGPTSRLNMFGADTSN